MDYYYIENNSQKGPIPAEELARIVNPDTKVWCPGMSDWTVASEVSELAVLMPSLQPDSNQSGFVTESTASSTSYSADSYTSGGAGNYAPNPGSGYVGSQTNSGNVSSQMNSGYLSPQMNSGYVNPQPNMANKPLSYLVFSIITTVLCCNAFGIPGIVYAARVEAYWNAGQYTEAQKAADNAKMWSWISFGVGLVWDIILFFTSLAGKLADLQ